MYMKRAPFDRMCLQEKRGGDYREGAQLRTDIAKAQEPFGSVITTLGWEPDFPQASSILTHLEKERQTGALFPEGNGVPMQPEVPAAEQEERGRRLRRNGSRRTV